MTYSRGAMVALLVCSPLFFFRSRKRLHLAVIAAALAVLLPFLAGKEIRNRFFTIEKSDQDASAQSRFESWEAACGIVQDYPIFGAGVARMSNQLSHRYGLTSKAGPFTTSICRSPPTTGSSGRVCTSQRWVRRGGACVPPPRRQKAATIRSCRRRTPPRVGSREPAAFCTGAVFLSCEAFEAQYILILLGAQLPAVLPALAQPRRHRSRAGGVACPRRRLILARGPQKENRPHAVFLGFGRSSPAARTSRKKPFGNRG